jgi:signal peptidase I
MPPFGVIGVLLTVVFPGLGQGLAGARRPMVAWVVGSLLVTVLILLTVWLVPVLMLVRIASAVDAYYRLKRVPRGSLALAAIALVAGVIVFVGARLLVIEGFKIPSSSMYPTLIIGDHIMVDKLSTRWHPAERGEVILFTQPCSGNTFIKRVVARGGDTVEVRCGALYLNGTRVPTKLVSPRTQYKDYDESSRRWYTRQQSRYRETIGGYTFDTFADVDRAAREERGEPSPHGDFPSRDRPFVPSCASGDFYDAGAPKDTPPAGTFVETKPEASAAACEPQLHYVVPPGTLFMMGDNRNNANDSRFWGVVRESHVIGRVIGIWASNGEEGGWGRFGALE